MSAQSWKDLQDDILGAILQSHKENGNFITLQDGNSYRVTTLVSSDENKSRTGGDYNYYRRYALNEGVLTAWNDWSCDFADYSSYDDPREAVYDLSKLVGSQGKMFGAAMEFLIEGNLLDAVAEIEEISLEFIERFAPSE